LGFSARRRREARGPLRQVRSWPIARSALGLVLKRWIFRIFLGLSLLNFLFHSAIIYLQAQVFAEAPAR
jgi:hypothetical protein